MAVYSAVKGSDAVVKLGGRLLCTAKGCELLTERELYEVYECFSVKPAAVVGGRESYKVILESLVFEDFDSCFSDADNITVEVSIGGKNTLLEGCRFSKLTKSINADGAVEKAELTALKRTESDEDD